MQADSTKASLNQFIQKTLFTPAKPLVTFTQQIHQVIKLNTSLIIDEDYLESPRFADIYLKSSTGKTFPAHRLILASSCPYFKEILLEHPTKGEQEVFFINWDEHSVETLLRFLYTGEIHYKKFETISAIYNITPSSQKIICVHATDCCDPTRCTVNIKEIQEFFSDLPEIEVSIEDTPTTE